MKIAFHVNQLDQRGSSVLARDYAWNNQALLGNESLIVSSRPLSNCPLDAFKGVPVLLYEDVAELPALLGRERIDFLYLCKSGADDGLLPKACRTGVHAVFTMDQPQGDVYAGVSEYLARKYGRRFFVPHIVDMPPTNEELRTRLGIPREAFVVGRHGGFEQFNIPFVHEAVKRVLDERKDLFFLFLNTRPFIEHERVRYLPFSADLAFKRAFINSCDAMLHARADGETFGLSVGEFSAMNRPVITYDTQETWYDRCHLDLLGDKALAYRNPQDLHRILLSIDHAFVKARDWDCYSRRFSPEAVMRVFDSVFLKGEPNIAEPAPTRPVDLRTAPEAGPHAKISLVMPVSYDFRYSYVALERIYDIADEIILGLDKDRLSWSKKPFSFDMPSFHEHIGLLDRDDKIRIVEDNFHDAVQPMGNDTGERNKLSRHCRDGNWIIQIDSDEFAMNPADFKKWLASVNPESDLRARWLTVFKTFGDTCLVTDGPSYEVCIGTRRKASFVEARETGKPSVLSPLQLLHFSWGRTRDELAQKLRNWSHAQDFDTEKYLSFWDGVTLENYKQVVNFHPLFPALWPKLRLIRIPKILDSLNRP
jgi:hypothetical protein